MNITKLVEIQISKQYRINFGEPRHCLKSSFVLGGLC